MRIGHTKLKVYVVAGPGVFDDGISFFLETFQVVRYKQEVGIELPFVRDD